MQLVNSCFFLLFFLALPKLKPRRSPAAADLVPLALLPRSDSSHNSSSASPHPTQAQANPHGSSGGGAGAGAGHGSQAQAISAVAPPVETVTSNTTTVATIVTAAGPTPGTTTCATTTTTATITGDARDHTSPQGGSNIAMKSNNTPLGTTTTTTATNPKMLLSDLYKSTKSPLSRFRHHPPHSAAAPIDITDSPDYDVDLVSRDKAKQKEAVKRYLAERIRSDWVFKWPPPSPSINAAASHEGNVTEEQEKENVAGSAGDGDGSVDHQGQHQHQHQHQEQQHVEGCAVVDTSSEEDNDDDDNNIDDDNDNDTTSNYSSVSEDLDHFRPRAEWLSDLSEDDNEPTTASSRFGFGTPAAADEDDDDTAEATHSAKRRKAVRDEMHWNAGLACFSARRDAWTGAKTARVRVRCTDGGGSVVGAKLVHTASAPLPARVAASPAPSPPASKRHSWFRLSISSAPMSTPTTAASTAAQQRQLPDLGAVVALPASPTGTQVSGDTMVAATTVSCSEDGGRGSGETRVGAGSDEEREGEVVRRRRRHKIETLLPLPAPLLPPANPMRASITPVTYPSIYDKIVVHSMTPACPINLQDVIRSCVSGWKRDGEWPPRPAEIAPIVAVRKKKAAAAAASNTGITTTTITATRSKTKDGGVGSGGGFGAKARSKSNAGGKPNAARRLSLGFLGRKDSAVGANATATATATGNQSATVGSPERSATTTTTTPAARRTQSQTQQHASSRGLRKSLQRVLGLGHASNTVALG